MPMAKGTFAINGIVASFPATLSLKAVTGIYTISAADTVLTNSSGLSTGQPHGPVNPIQPKIVTSFRPITRRSGCLVG